jgi:hypothetical protein
MAVKMGFEGFEEREQLKLGDCLWEIHAAGTKILEFTAGRDQQECEDDELLRSAVDAMLAIVEKALAELRTSFPSEYAKLPSASQMLAPHDEKRARGLLVADVVPELVTEARSLLEQWHQA